jgi:hypothetical protein
LSAFFAAIEHFSRVSEASKKSVAPFAEGANGCGRGGYKTIVWYPKRIDVWNGVIPRKLYKLRGVFLANFSQKKHRSAKPSKKIGWIQNHAFVSKSYGQQRPAIA